MVTVTAKVTVWKNFESQQHQGQVQEEPCLVGGVGSLSSDLCWLLNSIMTVGNNAALNLNHGCMPTNANTCSASFRANRLVLVHAQLLMRAEPAVACPVLDTWKHTQIHAQLLIRANRCRIMTGSWRVLRHAHSRSAFDIGPHMMFHIQPPIRTNTCSCMPSSRYMQKHAYTLSSRQTYMRWTPSSSIIAYGHARTPWNYTRTCKGVRESWNDSSKQKIRHQHNFLRSAHGLPVRTFEREFKTCIWFA